jgi:hypothetical protein
MSFGHDWLQPFISSTNFLLNPWVASRKMLQEPPGFYNEKAGGHAKVQHLI